MVAGTAHGELLTNHDWVIESEKGEMIVVSDATFAELVNHLAEFLFQNEHPYPATLLVKPIGKEQYYLLTLAQTETYGLYEFSFELRNDIDDETKERFSNKEKEVIKKGIERTQIFYGKSIDCMPRPPRIPHTENEDSGDAVLAMQIALQSMNRIALRNGLWVLKRTGLRELYYAMMFDLGLVVGF